jgi:hypothetical protein
MLLLLLLVVVVVVMVVVYSPNILQVIKSRRMRWAGLVALVGDRKGAYRSLVGRPEGRHNLEDRGTDEGIILKWILKSWGGEIWTGLLWLVRDRWPALLNVAMSLQVL